MDSYQKKIIIYVLVFFVILFLFKFLFLSAPRNFPIQQNINIKEGTSLRFLSGNLKDKNMIKSRVAFETLVIIYGGEKHIAPGDFLFEKKLSVFEIAIRIVTRDYRKALIKVTIPEGFDIVQIADTFSAKLENFNKNNFLIDAENKEGYLFPDTYFFFSASNEKEVLNYMTSNFKQKIKQIQPLLDATSRSQKEIIIMASIIEREAKGDEDREIISGILWNRISKNMPLQVDAAPITYKEKGLPINPICNPGLKAIEAAISPLDSSFFYYLHDKDGVIHFAKTFEEHKKNKFKYLK
ncbi:MAG: endolytic transglycosylase MltG [Candidatus Paceibacterota bacterium]